MKRPPQEVYPIKVSLFHKVGETSDEKYINRASEILIELSDEEKEQWKNHQNEKYI